MTEDRQWNPETLRMFVGVSWNPRGVIIDSLGGMCKTLHHESSGANAGRDRRLRACQGDAQVHVPRCRKRCEEIFDQEKQPGQPRVVVQQEKRGQVAEEATLGDQHARMEQEPQQQHRATILKPSAIPPQPSSSSHEDSMQVNTTPHRARIPEDDGDTRAFCPRLEMSTLISELCEGDVPEIDWEKLGEDNSSVFDIYTGLILDEAQVKAGRETEVKRMLEQCLCMRWSQRGTGSWQENLEQCLAGLTEETGCGEVKTSGQIKQEVHASATTCLRPHHHLQHCVSFLLCSVSLSWPLLRLVGVLRLRKKCLFVHHKTCGRTRPTGNLNAMYGTEDASSRWQSLVRETLCDGHCKVLTCVQCVAYNEIEGLIGDVSRR